MVERKLPTRTTLAEAPIGDDQNMLVAGRRGARFLRDLDFSVERHTSLYDRARSDYDAVTNNIGDEAKRTNLNTAISAPEDERTSALAL